MAVKKILMIVRTTGLEYDDRVRKEALSLKHLGCDVFILANYVSNASSKGITQYGIPYHAVQLRSRAIFASKSFLVLKMFELWLISMWIMLKGKYNVVWAHEEYTILSLIVKIPKIYYVFDQHELPVFLMATNFRKRLYRRIENVSDIIIVANEERLEFMRKSGVVMKPQKYCVMNNFTDKVFSTLKVLDLPSEIYIWLQGSPYILLQGGGHFNRYPSEVISAVNRHGKYKIILIGPVFEKIKEEIAQNYSDMVYLTGYVDQLELTRYIDHAKCSIILYADIDRNNFLCEPNRLYQAICRGIPVIVGINPPMRNLVIKHAIGEVLSDDGRSVDGIYEAILRMEENYLKYKENIFQIRYTYNWESQEPKVASILNSVSSSD
jgi:hypothetical protein